MPDDNNIFSVSELNEQAKQLLETGLGPIRLRGEVSVVTKSQAGHYYFSLKDHQAEIRCVLFRSTIYRRKIRQEPEQGQEIILDGHVSLYVPRGSYQFFINDIQFEQSSEGTLYQQFLRLKAELKNKGYFQDDRKKAIPQHPHSVGIVSSSSGAAVHDIIRAFNRRNPLINLLIYPTAVQGEKAPQEIAKAIQLANHRKEVDIILLSRGGGSLEDLAAFNSLEVAEAIYFSDLPVVTGIGHQTDVSIADYVADQAMATPTAAAEHLSTPAIDEMLQRLRNLESTLTDRIFTQLNHLGQRLDLAQSSLKHPQQRMTDLQNQFRAYDGKLSLLMTNSIAVRVGRLEVAHQQLLNGTPTTKIIYLKQRLDSAIDLLYRSTTDFHQKYVARITSLAQQLETMDPHSTLRRGYAIIRNRKNDSIVTDAASLLPGDQVSAQLAKGSLDLDVQSIHS